MQAYEWLSGTAGWNRRTDLLTDSNSCIINIGWMDVPLPYLQLDTLGWHHHGRLI